MTDSLENLSRSLHQMSEVLGNIKPDQATRSTPCASWDVQTLTSHVIGDLDRFTVTASGGQPDWSKGSPQVSGDWQAVFDGKSPELVRTWRRVEDLAAPVKVSMGDVPATFIVSQQVAELVVHAWDLTQATEQQPHWDDEIATASLEWARQALKAEFRGDEDSGKSFGPEQPPPPGASPTDQLAAFFGRRADWRS
jgi:uncharacterized protein (TIGR03086 family)